MLTPRLVAVVLIAAIGWQWAQYAPVLLGVCAEIGAGSQFLEVFREPKLIVLSARVLCGVLLILSAISLVLRPKFGSVIMLVALPAFLIAVSDTVYGALTLTDERDLFANRFAVAFYTVIFLGVWITNFRLRYAQGLFERQ
ncbi:hypothetical protein [Roseibium sp.]|uniref:hypothetical protein n=1 Tax=Roseibium sp. TaxID=1936156 RepID=UPI003A9713D6